MPNKTKLELDADAQRRSVWDTFLQQREVFQRCFWAEASKNELRMKEGPLFGERALKFSETLSTIMGQEETYQSVYHDFVGAHSLLHAARQITELPSDIDPNWLQDKRPFRILAEVVRLKLS